MDRRMVTGSLTLVAFALCVMPIFAQEARKAGETTITKTGMNRPWTEPAARWQKGSDLIGKNVQGNQGATLGEVEDMVIDIESGRVLYYIIGCDGKECVVPGVAMFLPADAKNFTIPATSEHLKAYAFETEKMPSVTDRTWTVEVHKHYNVRPVWEVTANADRKAEADARLAADRPAEGNVWFRFPRQTQRATHLIGMDVRNPQDENLGEIEDLVVDPDSGRIIYGVLSFGGFLGMGDKLFAIPWSSLKQTAGSEKQITLNVDKNRLKNATGFDKQNWPDMANPNWATELHSFYGTEPYWVEPKNRDETRP